ncbi:exosortase A [Tsuneonella sp. HG222]
MAVASLPAARLPAVPHGWRVPLTCLALSWLALFALTLRDWVAMAHQWWDVSTYNHALLIPAILAWLVHSRLSILQGIEPRAWWPGLVPLAGALLLWLLGTASSLDSASQLAAVVMLQSAVLAVLGPRVAAALLFPLAYMLFLVPFGDELVPLLQMITAKLTIALTHWSGIPAEIDGVFIDTPVGLFEVAEACSGVKFLIAMVALGALAANVCFRSTGRRAAFMALAVVLPVVANGIRAWGTIYIAQSQGIAFAAGFDHIFYGWIFFAIVMIALFALSWRFFDRAPGDVDPAPEWPILAMLERGRADPRKVVAAIAGLSLVFALWAGASRALAAELPARIALPQVAGWQRVDYEPAVWWEPRAGGADHRLLGRYRDAQGREVDVSLALYGSQHGGSDAGASGEGALMPDTAWRWLRPEPSLAGGQAQWLRAGGSVRRLAVTWYVSGDLVTARRSQLKLATMADRLAMRARPVGVLILSAEASGTDNPREAISAFLSASGSPGAWMDGVVRTN